MHETAVLRRDKCKFPQIILEVYRVIVMPSYMFHNDELRKRYSTNSLIKPIIAFFLGRGLS